MDPKTGEKSIRNIAKEGAVEGNMQMSLFGGGGGPSVFGLLRDVFFGMRRMEKDF